MVFVQPPAGRVESYLNRIVRGDVSAVKDHFHPDAALFYIQDGELLEVGFADLHQLIASWRHDDDHDPAIKVRALFEDTTFAILSAEFSEPQGVRYEAVFNLHRCGEVWWIWSANGRAIQSPVQRPAEPAVFEREALLVAR